MVRIPLIISFLFLALLTRVFLLGGFPVSLTIDEADHAYNAYSLLHTGRDEWGAKVPLIFKTVGDYTPPTVIYSMVPAIAIFGNTELAARLPLAVIGSLAVFVWFYILRHLRFNRAASLLSAIWLAVLPWHVHMSRYGHEAIAASTFLLLGLAFFLRSLRRQSFFDFSLCLSFFSLSVWSYFDRLFPPLLFIVLLVLNRHRLKFLVALPSKLLISTLPLFVFTIPFFYLLFTTPAITARAAATSILRDPGLNPYLHHGIYTSFTQKVFDNDLYRIFHHWSAKYLNYFDLRFWFWKAQGLTLPGYPDVGLLHLTDLPIFAAGVFALTISRNRLLRRLILFWFLIGPLAASFTMNEQHVQRSLVWMPFFGLVIASGFQYLHLRIRKLLPIEYLVLSAISLAVFADIYFTHFPRFFSEYWHYGYKQIAQYACQNIDRYDNILISETFGSLGPLISGIPYAYVLYYCPPDPRQFYLTREIPKFIFRRVDWKQDSKRPNALLISAPWDYVAFGVPQSQVIKQIDFLNGLPAFVFVDTSKN